jgi:shikimate 5-dehydrogenase
VLKQWNATLRGLRIDGSMDAYPCTQETLPERLSEMVYFDRRGYCIPPSLQSAIAPLMDRLDASAMSSQRVDTVYNDSGILIGFFTSGDDCRRREIWRLSQQSV